MGCKQAHQLGYCWPNNYMILLILGMELGASPKMRFAATLKKLRLVVTLIWICAWYIYIDYIYICIYIYI